MRSKISRVNSTDETFRVFNALIIIALIPLALRGAKYRPLGAATLLRDNLLIYGVGGIVIPFIVKLIDMLITRVGLAPRDDDLVGHRLSLSGYFLRPSTIS